MSAQESTEKYEIEAQRFLAHEETATDTHRDFSAMRETRVRSRHEKCINVFSPRRFRREIFSDTHPHTCIIHKTYARAGPCHRRDGFYLTAFVSAISEIRCKNDFRERGSNNRARRALCAARVRKTNIISSPQPDAKTKRNSGLAEEYVGDLTIGRMQSPHSAQC